MSLALYRKYRPATFAELKGQEHVAEPLQQALRNGRINHAYLFSGPRGCGKTSSARILARSLNCEQGPTPDPCGVCDSCVALGPTGSGHIDVIEIDAASHGGVDDARDLRERAFFAPVAARFKIYIIDEAHMVTREGFNALLKLVEEPPPHLKFVFATTEPEKVIGTIRSRTHHYPFRLIPPGVLRELLEEILTAESVPFEPAALPLVVRAGAGSARDSLSILDQLLAGADEAGITYARAVSLLGYTDASLLDEVVDAFATRDGSAVFAAVDRVMESGQDPRRFTADLLTRFRDLVILSNVPEAASNGLLDQPADELERMQRQASVLGRGELTRAADLLHTGLTEMRGATSPRLLLELLCARILLPGAYGDEASLITRLERLERTAGSGLLAAGGASAAQAPGVRPGPAQPAMSGSAQPATSQPPAAARPSVRPAPQEPAVRQGIQEPATHPAAQEPRARSAAQDPGARRAAQGPGVTPGGQEPGVSPGSKEPGAGPAAQGPGSRPAAQEPGGPGARGPGGPGAQGPGGRGSQGPGARPAAQEPGVRPGSQGAGVRSAAQVGAGVEPDVRPEAAANGTPAEGARARPAESRAAASGWPETRVAGRPEPAAEPAQRPQPQGAPNVGGLDVAAVRRAWPDILETIKQRSRVAWLVLQGGVQVAGLEGNLLTLAFDNEGNRKGFTGGGRDVAVREAVKELFGADVRIDTVPAGQAVPPSRPAPPSSPPPSSPPSSQPPPRPSQPQAQAPAPVQATPPPAQPQPKPRPRPQQAAPAGAPPQASPAPQRNQVPDLPPPPDEPPPFDESDEVDPEGDRDAGAEEAISGMALIQRELGGQVIKEIDNT